MRASYLCRRMARHRYTDWTNRTNNPGNHTQFAGQFGEVDVWVGAAEPGNTLAWIEGDPETLGTMTFLREDYEHNKNRMTREVHAALVAFVKELSDDRK